MRRTLLTTLLLLSVLASQAVTLHCEPGKLQSLLAGNTNITQLTLTGRMDARDFRTIADRLRNIQQLDLNGVVIVAHSSDKPLFANLRSYRAHEVPTMSLAQLTHLTRVTLPGTATSIGEAALAGCTALTSVTLPAELTHLGSYALAGCTALTTIALPHGLVSIGEGALTGCTALTGVTIAAAQSPMAGTSPSLERPFALSHIGSRAFAGCSNLKTVQLGFLVQHIGAAAFAGTKLTTADLTGMTRLAEVGDWAYAQTPITRALLPSTVTALGWGAFLLNTQLTQISLPSSLATLPALAMAGSNKLSQVDLSQMSIDSIGDYALYNLNKVGQVVIPSGTQYVGTRAMAGMTGLQQVITHADAVPSLGDNVWQNVDQSSVVLKVPSSSIDSYRSAEQWREFDIQSGGLPGDANGDGLVDIADINAVINYMLGRPNSTFVFDTADVDENGSIDIADINGIINLMLGKHLALPCTTTPNTGDMVTIENFAIHSGERHTIDVHLDNSIAYTALQCVIHLPEGLTPVGEVTLGSRTPHHQVASLVSGNEVRIVLYALPITDIEGQADQAILRLTVTADDWLANVSEITVDHVTLVTADEDIYYAPASKSQVSKSTGVSQVSQSADRVYAANGTLHITSAEGGRAQVVALNGTTRSLTVNAGSNSYHNIDPGYYIVRLNGSSYKVKL